MELDATAQVDQILANYEASQLILWITLGVIVIALIALGTEFWVNLWGIIFYPSITFQRLLGEAQWVPGIVVVAITGMSAAVIILSYFSRPDIVEKLLEIIDPANPAMGSGATQLDSIFSQLGSDFTVAGNIEYIKEYAFQTRSIAMAMPIAYIVMWFVWGICGQLASMIAGNKAGHGMSNLWSAIPFVFLVDILTVWFNMISLYGAHWALIASYIARFYFLFLHVIMMREHGRYDIGKAIVATILTLILVPIFILVVLFLIAAILVQAANYM